MLAGLEDQYEAPVSQWKALDPVLGVLRVTQHLSRVINSTGRNKEPCKVILTNQNIEHFVLLSSSLLSDSSKKKKKKHSGHFYAT